MNFLRIIPLLLSMLLTIQSHSQSCDIAIDSTYEVITEDRTINRPHKTKLWVCEGVTLDATYLEFTIVVVEANVKLKAFGLANYFYLKDSAHVELTGDSHTIYKDSTVTLIDSADFSTIYSCDSITYDYSNIPDQNCFNIPTGMNETREMFIPSIFPNPCHGQLQINVSNYTNVQLTLYNSAGYVVMSQKIACCGRQTIQIPTYVQDGIYFIHLNHRGDILSQKLIISRN